MRPRRVAGADVERVRGVSRWRANIRPALGFYKNTLHAELLEEWRTMRLDGDGIDRLAHLQ